MTGRGSPRLDGVVFDDVVFDGVVFDMDGVLIDSGAHHRAAWSALLADLEVTPVPEFWRLTIGRPAEEAVPLLLGRRLTPAEASALAARKREHYARLSRRGTLAVPGVVDFVAKVRRSGLPCAVATSASRDDARRLLGEIGVTPHFAAVISAEDVRRGKPDPEVYRLAAEAIGIDPARCLAFEDSLVGVRAARAAGMTVIGIATSHTESELVAAGACRAMPTFEGASWPP